jgi:lactosylceramide 4-alpha-galactosyltransferase
MDYVSCRGFNVLRTSSFYPVHFSELGKLFDQQTTNDTKSNSLICFTKEVIGVHVWNKLSKDQPVYKSSTQAYARLAQENCPVIFSIAAEKF